MAWGRSGNPGKHPLKQRGDDLYETPPEAVTALLKHEPIPATVWEPCCGSGNIVKVLRDAGHRVFASDLQDLGCPDSRVGMDFLMELNAPIGCDECILTNPPYKLADTFIRHALVLVPKVYMLLRFAFLEGIERTDILDKDGLSRVYLFKRRLPRMHRAGYSGKKATSMMAFAWFCWSRGSPGPIELRRIDWRG